MQPLQYAAFFLVFVALAGLALAADSLQGESPGRPSSVVVERTPRPEFIRPSPSPSPSPTPTPARPPAPPTNPEIPYTQTALVRVSDGSSQVLVKPGESDSGGMFSPDLGWLYYTHGPLGEYRISRVDLASDELTPEKFTRGFELRFSPSGDLAFGRRDADGTDRVFIQQTDGTRRELPPEAYVHSLTWSPDGRWLTYSEPFQGDDALMDQIIVDTRTWEQRTFAQSLPCQCDGGPRPLWSPDSSYFIYGPIHNSDGDGRPGVETGLYRPEGGPPEPAPSPRIMWWLDADTYVSINEYKQDGVYVRDVYTVNATSGERRQIAEASTSFFGIYDWSPDGLIGVASSFNPGATTMILDPSGEPLLTGLEGRSLAWSAESRYFLTRTTSEACNNGIAVYETATGSQLDCFSGPSHEGPIAAFSPAQPLLAYVIRTPLQDDPRMARPSLTNDLYVLDLETGAERRLLSGVPGDIFCLRWSPDGEWLMMGRAYDVTCDNHR